MIDHGYAKKQKKQEQDRQSPGGSLEAGAILPI